MSQNKLVFHMIIEQDKETGKFTAICLDLDIFVDGDTREIAVKGLKEAVDMYIDSVLEHGDYESLFRPAPNEYWRKAFHSKPAVELISA